MTNRIRDDNKAMNMAKWRKIGTYFDMSVEENGEKRRLVDFSGKIIAVYDF